MLGNMMMMIWLLCVRIVILKYMNFFLFKRMLKRTMVV